MSGDERKPFSPGDMVRFVEIPPGLLDGLPPEDQEAIRETIGKPVLLTEYSDEETVELKFTDSSGRIHFVFVKTWFLQQAT